MNANQKALINVIGDELRSGFFTTLSEQHDIDLNKIIETWDAFFDVSDKKEKKTKATTSSEVSPIKKTSGVKAKPAQGKTTAISRDQQTPVEFTSIDKLKVADLKALNKERGLPISGNKAILTEALKNYEKAEGLVGEEDATDGVEKEEKPKKRNRSVTKKDNKEAEKEDNVVLKKKNVKTSSSVVLTHIKPDELKTHKDEYENIIVADDLVCEEQDDGTKIVVGYKALEDDDGNIFVLDVEHVEKCKELNLQFKVDDTFDV